MLLFNYIEHLYSQTNYIGDVADKITASDWWRCDKLQLADSELGIYFIFHIKGIIGEQSMYGVLNSCNNRIFMRKDTKTSVTTANMVKERIIEAAHATRGIKPDTSLVRLLLVFA